MKKILFPFLFHLLLISNISAQKATLSLDTNEIFIGEQIKLRLELQFSAASKASFPTIQDSIDQNIPIVSKSAIDTSFAEKDVTTKILTQEFVITSFDTGYHPIRPISFSVDGDTVATQPTLLTVKTVPVPENADIKDVKSILDVPFTFWDWLKMNKWYILAALLLIALLIIGGYYYRKYRTRPKTVAEKPKPAVPAHQLAFEKLEKLKQKKLWQNGKVKQYHIELSYIIREYLENRYETNSLDNTTDEIILESRSLEMTEEDRKKLGQILLLADMAKFAKQVPVSYENEQSMKNAEAFVESSRLKPESNETDASTKGGEE